METERILNAEHTLAGAILMEPQWLQKLTPALRESDFQSAACRAVYQAARALEQEGKEIDAMTILSWAQGHGYSLSNTTAVELMDITPTPSNAPEYSRIVHDAAVRRELQRAMSGVAEDASTPVRELIRNAKAQLDELQDNVAGMPELIRASDVPYEPPRWLVNPYIPRGKGTMIQADPGTGKTAFVCALAAAVSTGRDFMGMKVEKPGNVLMLSVEDDPGVLRGRIEANGGNLDRVVLRRDTALLDMSSPALEAAIRITKARLVILDPLQAFLGAKVDFHRANETRPILARFFDLCASLDCACVIVAHLGKVTQGKNAVNQSLGSVDIPGAMRSIIHIGRDPSCPEERVAVHVKSSNAAKGQSMVFRIGERGAVEFLRYTDMEVWDLQVPEKKKPAPFDQDAMVEILNSFLAERGDCFVSYEDIQKASVKKLGCTLCDTSRQLRAYLEKPDFLRNMLEKEGVRITTGARSDGSRGIRLAHYAQPEGYQQRIRA